MNSKKININWPNGVSSIENYGQDWLTAAQKAGVEIPIGCLGGSCGACEIEVNGEVIRACVSKIESSSIDSLDVEIFQDPYW